MPETWIERVRKTIAPAAGESPSLLSASSGIIAIVAFYLYFAGYIFSYFYYQAFGVTLESLDVSTQYYFIRSFTVFQTPVGVLLLCLLVVIAYGYAAGKIGRGVLLVSLIAAFPAVYYLSAHVGRQHSEYRRSHPEAIVKFRFKSPEMQKPGTVSTTEAEAPKDELVRLGDAEELHLLLETKDRIVVYYQPKSSFSAGTPPIKVYTVLRSELNWSVVISG